MYFPTEHETTVNTEKRLTRQNIAITFEHSGFLLKKSLVSTPV